MAELGSQTLVDNIRRRMEIMEWSMLPHPRIGTAGRVVGLIGMFKRVVYLSEGVPVQIVSLVTHSEYRAIGIGRV